MRKNGRYDQATLEYINQFWSKNFYSPSMRDIMRGVGVRSSSHMAYILDKLEIQGLITISGDAHYRAITPAWVISAISNYQVSNKDEGSYGRCPVCSGDLFTNGKDVFCSKCKDHYKGAML